MANNHNSDSQERLIRLLEENEVLRSALDETNCGQALTRQQDEFSLLMNVSRQIVSELDLHKVLDLVVTNARELVEAELLVIPMINEAQNSYTYMAALGTDAETVLNSTLPIHVGMCGWVLKNGRSLLFGEASKCWLDEKTQWEEGQQSALLVPLFGRTKIIGGISALGKRGGRSFTHHDLDLLTIFASQVSMAIENAKLFETLSLEIEVRKKAEAEIAQALKEKEVLLAEIHHRVKNNMAVISSLLQMQLMVVEEAPVKQMLKECKQRVKSMALVHEKLYKSKDFSNINIEDYIIELVKDIRNSYGKTSVATSLDIADIKLSLNVLIPFGLIVNEIVSNSFKHAFEDIQNPQIAISLKSHNGFALLSISDNGVGFQEEECEETRTLGLIIIDALAGQINASIERDTENGVQYLITIPL